MISVIVPIYNVEKYLNKCVDSIINQTYKDLEIILVDDGSHDNSGKICDEYAEKDDRIVVVHKENGGVADSRNVGLDVARGQYIAFVDSDDYILPQMYEVLYDTLVKNDADICLCGFQHVDVDGTPIINHRFRCEAKNEILTSSQAEHKLNEKKCLHYAILWNKLYKRSLFDNLRFEKGRIHEDEYIVHYIFDKCKKIVSIENLMYLYVQRDGSITHSARGTKRFDLSYAFWDRYVFFKKNYPECAHYQLKRTYWEVYNGFKHFPYFKSPKEHRKIALKVLAEFIKRFDLRCVKLFVVMICHLF